MENSIVVTSVEDENVSTTAAISGTPPVDLNQHYKQHFQQHYASATAAQQHRQQQQQAPSIHQQSSVTFQTNPPQPSLSGTAHNPETTSTSINIMSSSGSSGGAGIGGGGGIGGIGGGGGGGGGSMNDSYASRVQVIESDCQGNTVRKVEERRHSKHTTQTTTTTTSTSSAQPTVIMSPNELSAPPAPTTPVHFAAEPGIYYQSSHLAYVQQPVPIYAVAAAPCLPIPVVPLPPPTPLITPPPPQPITHYTTSSGNITVEHYPSSGHFTWSNADTYMHIFLTFYFGHFAAMLFFDGIVRQFVNLYLFEHRDMSMLIYILHIILSIALLAFCVWFMTICWRWWRNKSLLPMYGLPYYDYNQRPLGPKERQATFHGCVFTAAVILIVSFFCYLILGVLDLSFKRQLQSYYYSSESSNGYYHAAAYYGDLVVFILRLVLWVVGIFVTLLLSRDILFKFCCPERRIKIDKERPTTVYQVRNSNSSPKPNKTIANKGKESKNSKTDSNYEPNINITTTNTSINNNEPISTANNLTTSNTINSASA